MKCLTIVIIALVAFAAADEEWRPPSLRAADEFAKQCNQELSPAQKIAINEGDAVDTTVACHFKKMGIFSDEHGFDIDRFIAFFNALDYDAEKSREGLTECVETNKKTSTVAEWAFRTYNCLREVKLVSVKRKASRPRH